MSPSCGLHGSANTIAPLYCWRQGLVAPAASAGALVADRMVKLFLVGVPICFRQYNFDACECSCIACSFSFCYRQYIHLVYGRICIAYTFLCCCRQYIHRIRGRICIACAFSFCQRQYIHLVRGRICIACIFTFPVKQYNRLSILKQSSEMTIKHARVYRFCRVHKGVLYGFVICS